MFTVETASLEDRVEAESAYRLCRALSVKAPAGPTDLAIWHRALDAPANLAAAQVGVLAETLSRPQTRSALLCLAAEAPENVVASLAVGVLPPRSQGYLYSVMDSRHTGVEPSELAQSVVVVLAQIAGHFDEAHAYAMLGLLGWWQGLTREAAASAATAIILDPRHDIAQLALTHLLTGARPGWQHRQDAAFADIADSFNKEH